MIIKIIALVCFFALMIGVGIYSQKKVSNANDFVLGGRSVGPWVTAFSYGTSYFSAVVFIGYAGQFGWRFGIASTWIGLANAFIGSLLAWRLLGRRTRVMTKHLSAATMPDFFGKRFESNALRIAASVISFVFLILFSKLFFLFLILFLHQLIFVHLILNDILRLPYFHIHVLIFFVLLIKLFYHQLIY